ncbi:MAG: hypothetical protein HRT35_36690 [Algicola sp.]|nr:hypothetical protein [Algicola sp.]
MNPTLIAAGLGGILALSAGFMWQMEKVKSATFEGQVSTLNEQLDHQLSENLKLTNAVSQANEHAIAVMTLVNKNNEHMLAYSDKLEKSAEDLANLRTTIDNMRSTELKNAIEKPYERGNAAADRWTAVMQLIADSTSPDSKSGDDTNTAQSSTTTEVDTAQGH